MMVKERFVLSPEITQTASGQFLSLCILSSVLRIEVRAGLKQYRRIVSFLRTPQSIDNKKSKRNYLTGQTVPNR
jgi:hypothetical protein